MAYIMTDNEFIKKLKSVVNDYETLYVMGCLGAPLVGDNVEKYCNNHKYNKKAERTAMILEAGNRNPPIFGFDCVCLIKSILWGWCGDPNKKHGGTSYKTNGVPDVTANMMIQLCEELSTDFSDIVPGEAVWKSGHIGVYIGDGLVIECTPSWENGVQITAASNLGKKAGYVNHKWTKHGKFPWIEYSFAETQEKTEKLEFALNEIVEFTGNKHYVSANATVGTPCKPGVAKITMISKNSKHPYHVINIKGKGSNAYGWVDANVLKKHDANERTYTVKTGDTLWGIAKEFLGSGSRYTEIMKLNDLKTSTIKTGQVLKIPE